MADPLKVYVVVADFGLAGADALSVHSSHELAQAAIDELHSARYPRIRSFTGYGGCQIVELTIDERNTHYM